MTNGFEQKKTPSVVRVGRFLERLIFSIDWPLLAIVVLISAVGFIALYSAGYSFPWRIESQIRNIGVAFVAMIIFANIPLKWLKVLSIPLFVIGVFMLIATLLFGVNVKGATRWLNIGVAQIQPSELMKIATPLLLATYFQLREDSIRWWDYALAFVLLFTPVALILKQPDLGTSILVFCAGFAVIFFAGISWKFLVAAFVGLLAMLPILWTLIHDYQRQRILTLLDPSSDPLGAGFHTLQAIIAIGSGGFSGKGWMNGTQAHLDFIPERTSDFLFAVYSEEFGFIGDCALLLLFSLLITRTILIAARAKDMFGRLVGGAIATVFLIYSFVNMGMVSGILPVVGVPLPFMSYGGTAFLILGICCGILMRVSSERQKKEEYF